MCVCQCSDKPKLERSWGVAGEREGERKRERERERHGESDSWLFGVHGREVQQNRDIRERGGREIIFFLFRFDFLFD